MKKCHMQCMGVIICVFLTTAMAQAVQRYQVLDLGQGYRPLSFNENGQVILLQSGSAFESPSVLYLWQNGPTTQLYQTDGWIQWAVVNNSGTIAVNISENYGSTSYSLIMKENQIDTLPSYYAWDMNDSGQIVLGVWDSVTEQNQTYLRNPDGSFLDFGNGLYNFIAGIAINNLGQVTGATGSDYQNFTAFVWDAVSGIRYLPRLDGDMGALGMAINASGVVAGYSATSMGIFPDDWDWNLVLWNADGQITDLGCKLNPMGKSVSLNNAGQLVGSFKLPGDTEFLPYFWQEDTGFLFAQDLLDDDSLWTITSLTEINNLGQIIGTAMIDGEPHAVLLMPIPEPGILSLLLVGMVFFRKERK